MRQRSVRLRQRGSADVAAFVQREGGAEQARITCEFFGYELTDADPTLLRGLLSEFDSKLTEHADLRRLVEAID